MENAEGKTPRPAHHPHDMLFKAVFKQPRHVRELLEAKAPKGLLAILELGSLRLTDASYVDEKLSEQMADIVLDCNTDEGDKVQFSFILEHKSYVPTYPPHQVMGYQHLSWGRQIADKNSFPVPLVPVVFFHGEYKWVVRPWKAYLKGWRKEFEPYTPSGGYIFIDLSTMTDEEIKRFRSGFLKTALLLMKHRFEREFLLENLAETVNFVEMDEEEATEVRFKNLDYILRYLLGLKSVTWEEIKQKLKSLIMTNQAIDVIEDLRVEAYQEGIGVGRGEGIEIGIEKGIGIGQKKKNYFGTYNLLQMGFAPEVIARALNVSTSFVEAVQNKLHHVPRITELLEEGNLEMDGIAKKLKLPILFVKAVKNNIDKNKQP